MSKKIFRVKVHLPNGAYSDDGLQSWLTRVIEYHGRQTNQESPELEVIVEVIEP